METGVTETARAEKQILRLLEERDLRPSVILDQLSSSFDNTTIREAMLNLVTQQRTQWKYGRHLSLRRHRELTHG